MDKNSKVIEYRIRPVTRWTITRFENQDHGNGRCSGGSETLGEFDNEDQAARVRDMLHAQDGTE